MIKEITDANFVEETSKGLVLVEFWASWCSYCKMLEPVLEELGAEYADKIKIAKINVEENELIPNQYDVMGLPLMILFEDGLAKEKIVGYYPKKILKEYFDEVLSEEIFSKEGQ